MGKLEDQTQQSRIRVPGFQFEVTSEELKQLMTETANRARERNTAIEKVFDNLSANELGRAKLEDQHALSKLFEELDPILANALNPGIGRGVVPSGSPYGASKEWIASIIRSRVEWLRRRERYLVFLSEHLVANAIYVFADTQMIRSLLLSDGDDLPDMNKAVAGYSMLAV